MLDPHDTIAALASPPGGAARGIVRVSGPDAVKYVEQCFVPDDGRSLARVRRPTALPGKIIVHELTKPLPGVVYLWPSSRSYTRQPTAELHTTGSPPLLDALLADICRFGARLALPGEFTLRAFLAGRLDLTQAEAVLGVIDARGRNELEVALSQLAGGLAAPLAQLRGELLDALAHLEAGLDFVDEDIEFISRDDLHRQLTAAQREVEQLAMRVQTRAEANQVFRAVFSGAPNVGKSSLFNALTGQSALVSEIAGTTRDYLTARLELDGLVCELVDTAGIGERPGHNVDAAAQVASQRQQKQAEVQILCLDATRDLTTDEEVLLICPPVNDQMIVFTKCDQPRRAPVIAAAIETSSHTGAGLDQLRMRLGEAGRAGRSQATVVASTGVRCHDSLRQAANAVAEALRLTADAAGEELVAVELRAALNHLGEVAGVVYTDDILDRIFSRFCIGK